MHKIAPKNIKRIGFFTSILVVLLIARCEDEKPVGREYPRLAGTIVSNVSDSGATFSASLSSLGTESPEEYGFLWGLGDVFYYRTADKVILGKPEKSGTFSVNIRTALVKDRSYGVVPFVKTEEHIVYGPVAKFNSLGSQGPVINGFYPDSAAWGDTIRVIGKNFSYVAESNKIKLNQTTCQVVRSTDSTVFFVVDQLVTSLKNVISVDLGGNINKYIKDTFRLIPPRIYDFQPRQGNWGDTLNLTGKGLRFIKFLPTNYIKLGTFNCSGIPIISDTVIKILVPFELTANSNNLLININGFTPGVPGPFVLLSPYFSFSPVTGTWGNTVTLNGRFNTLANRNKVYFSGVQANIISATATKMVVTVPSTLSDIKSVIKYNVTPFSVVSVDSFTLLPPVIKSFTPLSGPSGTTVTVRGKNFSTTSSSVKFGTIPAPISSMNDSTIIAKVPAGVNGSVKISITAYNQSITSTDDFLVTNPRITTITPLSGTFNDQITITGEYFIPPTGTTTVSFGGLVASVVSVTGSEIVARIPTGMDSIPKTVTVLAGVSSTVSTEKITLTPPLVYTVTPEGFVPGSDIVITGTNFNPVTANNRVFWDIYPLTVKSSTTSEIVATWPSLLPRGNLPVTITVGGYSRRSIEKFKSNSLFLRLEAPKIHTHFSSGIYWGVTNYAAGIKNYGYVASPASDGTYRFDPSDNSWINTNLGFPYASNKNVKAGVTTLGDTLYIIGGPARAMLAFDPDNNGWKYLDRSVFTAQCVAFGLNNKIYLGMDWYSDTYSKYFFEINPATGYSWLRIADVPAIGPKGFSSYFSVNYKGYVVCPNNEVWQFDPDSFLWFRKSNFPGTARTMAFSFVLDGYAYYGTGLTGSNINMNDLWKYDYSADTWTFVGLLPVGRYSSVAFTVNGKAYIGFGAEYNSNGHHSIYDFYEFDPNYILK